MRSPENRAELHERLREQRVEALRDQLDGAAPWVRKNVFDDLGKTDAELLRQAQWHERTALNHQTCARALRVLLETRGTPLEERVRDLFNVYGRASDGTPEGSDNG